MWRTIVAVIIIAHGLVHLIGFVVPWRIATLDGFPYRTDVLSHVELGSPGVKVLGILWLLAAIGFVAVGVALLSRSELVVGARARHRVGVAAVGGPLGSAGIRRARHRRGDHRDPRAVLVGARARDRLSQEASM